MTITMTELEKKIQAESELPVCEHCGWYDSRYTHRCDPARGRAAETLIREVPEIDATRLGYGSDKLTFVIDEDLSITFELGAYLDGPQIGKLFCTKLLSIEQAAKLVRALKEIIG